MTILLTYNGTTAALSDRLQWTDEYDWSPVEQSTEFSTTGALLVDVAVKLAGRPITLEGLETAAWLTRAVCDTLQAWAALPGITLTLTVRGVARAVLFDQARKGFTAAPVWRLADGEHTEETLYLPTFRFLEK
jgi:hypothetical protein